MTSGFTTRSAAQTERAGAELAALVRPGDVVALAGDLGAGKTHLVQGVARGLGVDGPVTSPTFNLLLVHHGRLTLYHFDLYRLEREADLEEIGFYETLEGDGISMIEWGDRFPGALPPDRLLVVIRRTGAESRRFDLLPTGPRSEAIARAWSAACRTDGDRR
jgi:tRNA threonylcarbamoyladenosine biosynthesis protein TsaE